MFSCFFPRDTKYCLHIYRQKKRKMKHGDDKHGLNGSKKKSLKLDAGSHLSVNEAEELAIMLLQKKK